MRTTVKPTPEGPTRDHSKRESTEIAQRIGEIRVFASFDIEHDKDLYELLDAQSAVPGSSFKVSARSERFSDTHAWSSGARRRINAADQVIVICGEHTDVSSGVIEELRIAQQEDKPYFLLWGRRESMCTKPPGAKSAEGMFSWTLAILLDQMARMDRAAMKRAETARTVPRSSSRPGLGGRQ
jgi:hypothetical protein